MIGLTRKSTGDAGKLFSSRKAKKKYLAVVWGHVDPTSIGIFNIFPYLESLSLPQPALQHFQNHNQREIREIREKSRGYENRLSIELKNRYSIYSH